MSSRSTFASLSAGSARDLHPAATSPAPSHALARSAAALNILSGVGASYSIKVLQHVFIRGDAAGTTSQLVASESSFRLAMVAEVTSLVVFICAMLLTYELFKPADRRLARIFVCLATLGAAIQSLDVIADNAALTLAHSGAGVAAAATLQAATAQALVYLSIILHSQLYRLALVFMGFGVVALGITAMRSNIVPRVTGALLLLDGAGYVASGLVTWAFPAIGARLYPYVPFVTAIVGEAPFFLWLLIMGARPTLSLRSRAPDVSS